MTAAPVTLCTDHNNNNITSMHSNYIDRVYIEGASSRCLNAQFQVSQCTDVDDLLCCSATVGNLGERGEPDILTSYLRALRTRQSTQDLHFNRNAAGPESNPGPSAF